MTTVNYLYARDKKNVQIHDEGKVYQVHSSEAPVSFYEEGDATHLSLSCKENLSLQDFRVLAVLQQAFNKYPEVLKIQFNQNEVLRTDFFQNPANWCVHGRTELQPERWMHTKDVYHPVRPQPVPGELLYSRYVPSLKQTVSFRAMDADKDLETFHFWHNQPYVAEFWELNKSKEELKEYLLKGIADLHSIPTFVEIDGVPVGYFEMYWTLEDRLGPYYESEAYDRGFHLLIGNKDYLGFNNTDAILKSATHYLFLDEPRTRKIMAEPRSDNKRIIRYIDTFTAWRKVKEFDFPHKRAALLECRREKFFLGQFL